ncbi:hypothetical protein [Brevibacillus sp. NRS-1366]|uniref:hypothetical protein n=1 Tax=Brevibacillus sp. NRS-1366 TaxID=3233899 RepID=UPI003D25B2B9
MRFTSRSFSIFALISFFVFLTGFSSEDKKIKATWIWHTTLIASEPDQIISFSKEQGVNLLYLRIDISRKPAYYQAFLKKANEAGIKIHALSGSPAWGLVENRSRIMALVDWVIAYNQAAANGEKFSGIHFDIEPYLLPEWKTDQASVVSQWKENVAAYTERVKQYPALEIGCDIPFWLDKIYLPDDSSTALSKWLISKHDHVTIMSYRDRVEGPNSISSLVTEEIGWADELGKKIVLAVETKESSEGNYISFYEEGKAYMDQMLSRLSELMSSHPSFAGTAIHSYEHWTVLKP